MSGASRWLDARNGLRHVPAATTASTTQASLFTEHLLSLLRRRVATGCVKEGGRGKGLGHTDEKSLAGWRRDTNRWFKSDRDSDGRCDVDGRHVELRADATRIRGQQASADRRLRGDDPNLIRLARRRGRQVRRREHEAA